MFIKIQRRKKKMIEQAEGLTTVLTVVLIVMISILAILVVVYLVIKLKNKNNKVKQEESIVPKKETKLAGFKGIV